MLPLVLVSSTPTSLPLWERGLKCNWIDSVTIVFCRSPCGSED